jgi:hypothetical protein
VRGNAKPHVLAYERRDATRVREYDRQAAAHGLQHGVRTGVVVLRVEENVLFVMLETWAPAEDRWLARLGTSRGRPVLGLPRQRFVAT